MFSAQGFHVNFAPTYRQIRSLAGRPAFVRATAMKPQSVALPGGGCARHDACDRQIASETPIHPGEGRA
jgi:hypothetical protein